MAFVFFAARLGMGRGRLGVVLGRGGVVRMCAHHRALAAGAGKVFIKGKQAKGIQGNAETASLGEGEVVKVVRDAKGKSVHRRRIAQNGDGVKMAPKWRHSESKCVQICPICQVNRRLVAVVLAHAAGGRASRLTGRAADTATPWASRGDWSGKVGLPAVAVRRPRRAADAIVGQMANG